jgi:hypothetical protein
MQISDFKSQISDGKMENKDPIGIWTGLFLI